jgi:hypothetical protein
MQTRLNFPAIFLTLILVVLVIFSGCSKKSADTQTSGSNERPTISKAEQAFDMLQVQNTYSKHAYYHAYPQLYCQELEDIWVKEDGPNAETASWTNAQGIQIGMELIKKNYCTENMKNVQKSLDAISKIYPEIENIPENLGAGTGYTIHTQTTPIIEVAGDGKTAKGLWYSPGIATNTMIKNGKAETGGNWFFEKYAIDFVKEDGEWKIWHVGMYYDPTPPTWGSQMEMIAAAQPVEAGEKAPSAGGLEMTKPNPNPYETWSPKSVLKLEPSFPEPYYTFSETFSY